MRLYYFYIYCIIFSGFITLKIKSLKLLRFSLFISKIIASVYAYKLGYIQASIVCFLFMLYLILIANERDAVKFSLFVILLTILSLIISDITSHLTIGKASAERLIFLSVMNGLFLFFTTTLFENNRTTKISKKKFSYFYNKSFISSYRISSINFILICQKVGFVLLYSFYTIG